MYKKISGFFVALILAIGLAVPSFSANAASFCDQYIGVKKIWWDGIELKSGQIGRLIVLKDTPLYKVSGENKTFSRTLKKGEFYRIYAFKPGMLSVGGGYYVDRDSKVKYETPSKTKLDAVRCINGTYQPPAPQPVSHFALVSKTGLSVEEKQLVEKWEQFRAQELISDENGNSNLKSDMGVYKLDDDLFIISGGQQPTGGYSVELVKSEVLWEKVIVHVRVKHPNPDVSVPQVIDHPYAIGKSSLPPYTTLTFKDAATGEELPIEQFNEGKNSNQVVITAKSLEGEIVSIKNSGNTPADLTGWTVVSVEGNQSYKFPDGYILAPGATVYLTSGKDAKDQPPTYLKWTNANIWNNDGDAAQLFNSKGEKVSEM